jgi:hypothetical protein
MQIRRIAELCTRYARAVRRSRTRISTGANRDRLVNFFPRRPFAGVFAHRSSSYSLFCVNTAVLWLIEGTRTAIKFFTAE